MNIIRVNSCNSWQK